MDYYKNHGAKNRKLSEIPVPSASYIKQGRKYKIKPLKYSPQDFDSIVSFNQNLTNEEKIEFKKELIIKGESYIKNKEYDKAIAFFTRLLTHRLFINDYYQYNRLSYVYKKEKRMEDEVNLLVKFFKSGIYCDKKQLRKFKSRLRRLSNYGFYDYTKISELELEFLEHGASNSHFLDEPVLCAKKIIDLNY